MKTTIIPDYIRYTDFDLETRVKLEEYARAHGFLTGQLIHADQTAEALAHTYTDPKRSEHYKARAKKLRGIIGEIDEEILKIYKEHGRVN